MVFGLRVVTTEGTPPTKLQLIVRNLLHIPDLLIVPLFAILFTPLRQRFGDLVAKTMVVTRRE